MKLVKIFAAVLFVSASFFLSQCKKDDPGSGPQVTGFSPVMGHVGDVVVVTGRNFSTVVANDKVNFNGASAFIIDANATSITAAVPPGATTGKIAVTVEGTTVFSADEFTVFLTAPGITSFSPTYGIAGTSVVISGNGFSTTMSNNTVKFNGVAANITAATATSISVIVPDGATTGKVTVTVTDGTTPTTYTSTFDFTVPLPAISGFTPAYGLPGTNITITGENFNSGSPSSNIVTINGTNAAVTVATANQLTVTVPALATTGKIKISIGGQSVLSATDYEVVQDIPRDGLVAFYPFNGNADDTSGNHIDGTPIGSPASTTDRFGIATHAYVLDGVNDYITMGNPALLQTTNTMTVAGWFNMHESSPTNMRAMIVKIFFDPLKGGNPETGYYFSQNQNSTGMNLYSYLSSGAGFAVNQGIANTTTNGWIFVAFVTDGVSWKFFKDDAVVSGNASSGNANPDATQGDFVVGSYGGGFFFNGGVDDVTVYNRALNDAEIQQLYKQTVSKY